MMQSEKLYWALLNRSTVKQVSGLTFSQAQFFVDHLDRSQFDNWLAWHEGLEKWLPLKTFKNLIQKDKAEPLYVPPMPPNIEYKPTNIDKRVNARFLKTFKVEILNPVGQKFINTTVNVSSNGMLLQKSVPDSVGLNFNCRIVRNNGEFISAFCSLIRTGKDSELRKRVKFMDVSKPKVLLAWLVDSQIS